jgi:hypothetical protein
VRVVVAGAEVDDVHALGEEFPLALRDLRQGISRQLAHPIGDARLHPMSSVCSLAIYLRRRRPSY